jgi:hypothetical protein
MHNTAGKKNLSNKPEAVLPMLIKVTKVKSDLK